MSVWYSLEGIVKVKACPEAEQQARRLGEAARSGEFNVTYEDNGDGTASVAFEGGTQCSSDTADTLDALAKELGRYAVEPVMLLAFDGEDHRRLYVGPPEKEAECISKDALEEIAVLLPYLTDDHRAQLKEDLDNR